MSTKITLVIAILGALFASYEFGNNVWINSHERFALVADVNAMSLRLDLEVIHTLHRQLNDLLMDQALEKNPKKIAIYETRIREIREEINRLRDKVNK